MRNIFIATMIFFSATAANASMNCVDMWGHKANIKLLDSRHMQIQFSTRKYPGSSSMSYNGSNSTSHYFLSGSKMAQVEKTVFTQGIGKFWYHYPKGGHPAKTVVRFTCN